MFTWIRQFFAAPVFDDEEKTRLARLLNGTLQAILVVTVLGSAIVIAVEPPDEAAFSLVFGVIMTTVLLALRSHLHRGHVKTIGTVLALVLWVGITIVLALSGGIGNVTVVSYFLLIAVTGLLLGVRFGYVFAMLSLLAIAGLFVAETAGVIEAQARTATEPTELIVLAVGLILATLLIRFIVRTIALGLERARRNERALAEREQALAERNRELEAGQRVTIAASERVSPDELLGLVVDMVRDQFQLYHVQAYIVDQEQKVAVLRESTGYAGYQLLQMKHRIPLDRPALVSKAISDGQPVVVADVNQDPDFMPNPLLPATRSELVVPLKIANRVIGVLDAQDSAPDRFSVSTVALFQTMAEQIAFLYENSGLLESVSEQTEALAGFANQLRTAADIAQRLGTILDLDHLLQEVVDLMQGRFGLYHVHIYLLDEATRVLTVCAGSGEVGRVLRERAHSISLDQKKSLVARAARTREVVLVEDTSLDSDFLPNPLLPQTRTEMSIPLVVSEKMLGVLDLQDDQPGRFGQSDLDTFSILAGQVAIAIENARLFEEQQQVQSALREREDRYRDVLARSNDLIAEHDLAGRILTANKQAAEVLGYDRSELQGLNIRELLSPEFRHEFDGYLATIHEHGTASGLMHVQTRMGETRIWEYDNILRTEGLSQPVVRAMARDVTQARQAQEERVRFTNQLRAAAELAQQINTIHGSDRLLRRVVTLLDDRLGFDNVYIYLLDEEACDLVMCEGSGEVGRALRENRHKIPLDRNQSLVARAVLKREILVADGSGAKSDAESAPLLPGTPSEVAVPLVAGDKVLGVIDVQNMEARLLTQGDLDVLSTLAGQIATAVQNAALFEDLQQTGDRLRVADRLKSELLASLNYELRTPLNAILGYTEVMLDDADGSGDAGTHKHVQAIRDKSQHLVGIIDDLLDLARIESGDLALSLEQVQVEALVDEIGSSDPAGIQGDKPIELSLDVKGDLPPVQADPTRLRQILGNLVSSAVKLTDGGNITLRASSEDGWVCVEVENRDASVSEADLQQILEGIGQADFSGERSIEAADLGLVVAHHLVEMHGGALDVRSQLGQGSRFTVRLPV